MNCISNKKVSIPVRKDFIVNKKVSIPVHEYCIYNKIMSILVHENCIGSKVCIPESEDIIGNTKESNQCELKKKKLTKIKKVETRGI